MPAPPPRQNRDADRPENLPVAELKAARDRGLAWLDATIGADGRWPSRLMGASGQVQEEFPPFAAATGYLMLESCGASRAQALRARTQRHIERICEYPGLWRYWNNLPPDLDDTSVCSIVSASHIWIFLGLNIEAILRYRDRDGRFRTWMVSPEDIEAEWNEADAVVNANVIAYLGDRPQTRPAQRWIEELLRQGREAEALVYYSEPMDLYLAVARAARLAPPAFSNLRCLLIRRILDVVQPRRGGAAIMRLAQGVVALDTLGKVPEPAVLTHAATRIVEEQHAEGMWPTGNVWRRGPKYPVTFRSVVLATASCIAAIEPLLGDESAN